MRGGGGEEKQDEKSLHLCGCNVYTLFIVVVYNEPSWTGREEEGRGSGWLRDGLKWSTTAHPPTHTK